MRFFRIFRIRRCHSNVHRSVDFLRTTRQFFAVDYVNSCFGSASRHFVSTAALLDILSPPHIFVKSIAFNASFNTRCNGWYSHVSVEGYSEINSLIEDVRLLIPSDQIEAEYVLDDEFEWLFPEVENCSGNEVSIHHLKALYVSRYFGAGYFCESL